MQNSCVFLKIIFKDFLNSQENVLQLKGHRIKLRAIWHYSYTVTVGNFGVKTKLNELLSLPDFIDCIQVSCIHIAKEEKK